MCTKKNIFDIEKFILFSTHYIYEKKSISRWHPGNYSYRLMRGKKKIKTHEKYQVSEISFDRQIKWFLLAELQYLKLV